MGDKPLTIKFSCLDSDGLVYLDWDDASRSAFHPIWLRDNGCCKKCGDPATGCWALRLTSLDLNCKPESFDTGFSKLLIT